MKHDVNMEFLGELLGWGTIWVVKLTSCTVLFNGHNYFNIDSAEMEGSVLFKPKSLESIDPFYYPHLKSAQRSWLCQIDFSWVHSKPRALYR